jgi:hypothetical protein
MSICSSVTPAQHLAQSLLWAWSTRDFASLAASLDNAGESTQYGELSREEQDILDLVIGIGTTLRDSAPAVNDEELRVSVKLLRHFAQTSA